MDWTDKRDGFLGRLRGRPQVMGILNVTPDSFSDGGQFETAERAMRHAAEMEAEGADILDIGGESTRPGAIPVAPDDELRRVIPVIRALSGASPLPISVDTYKARVAREAVKAGAVVINDVWGLQKDPDMPDVAADSGAAVVLMHNRANKDPDIDIMDDMHRFLDRSFDLATRAGVALDHILVDPGIGFGKTPEQSMTCINRLHEMTDWFERPILLGLSRKRFIGHITGRDTPERLAGTLASNMMGLARGASVLRVHDVAAHADAAKMYSAIREAT